MADGSGAGAVDPGALLSVPALDQSCGPVQALTGVDLDVPAAQATAVLGDNGAGKSGLVKTISGIHAPDGGRILWEGRPVHFRTPKDATALGINTVFQDLALCDNLDIVQNMFLGRERRQLGVFLAEDDMEKAAAATLASLSVTTVRSIRQPVASLSGGHPQSQALARSAIVTPILATLF